MEAGAVFLVQRKYQRYIPLELCNVLVAFLTTRKYSLRRAVGHFVSYERWSQRSAAELLPMSPHLEQTGGLEMDMK